MEVLPLDLHHLPFNYRKRNKMLNSAIQVVVLAIIKCITYYFTFQILNWPFKMAHQRITCWPVGWENNKFFGINFTRISLVIGVFFQWSVNLKQWNSLRNSGYTMISNYEYIPAYLRCQWISLITIQRVHFYLILFSRVFFKIKYTY